MKILVGQTNNRNCGEVYVNNLCFLIKENKRDLTVELLLILLILILLLLLS